MRIDVLVPSREREQSLQAVLVSLHALSSGAHDVRYVVVCDDDDIATKAVAMTISGMDIRVDAAPRAMIHKRENALIAKSDADVFMPWADDLFCLSPSWDEIIANIVTKAKLPAFSWQEVQDPKNHTAIVLTKEWVKAAGRFYPEYFPFWFADTWMKEVFAFVYGQDMPIVEHLRFSHKRAPTINMHDLAFWFKVFAHTRPERIEEARRVAAVCDIPFVKRPDLTAIFERADAWQLQRVPQYEVIFGSDREPPSAAYLEAKEKAEKMMSEAALEAA